MSLRRFIPDSGIGLPLDAKEKMDTIVRKAIVSDVVQNKLVTEVGAPNFATYCAWVEEAEANGITTYRAFCEWAKNNKPQQK